MGLLNRASGDPRAGRKKNTAFLVNADFAGIATADVTPVAGQFVVVGTRTVPFGVLQAWGADDYVGTTNRQGQATYVGLADASGNILKGMIRLVVADPQRVNLVRVFEARSEFFAASTTVDRNKSLLLPEIMPLVQPQSLMELWFKGDAATVIDYDHASTVILIPTTYYV